MGDDGTAATESWSYSLPSPPTPNTISSSELLHLMHYLHASKLKDNERRVRKEAYTQVEQVIKLTPHTTSDTPKTKPVHQPVLQTSTPATTSNATTLVTVLNPVPAAGVTPATVVSRPVVTTPTL